jgi:hypothetical protein
MPIDYTKDFMAAAERNSALQLQAASMSGGGKGAVTGGGYVGVAFLPQRPIGGMVGRMSYGAGCTPVFGGELLKLKGGSKRSVSKRIGSQRAISKNSKDDCECDCEKKIVGSELNELFNKQVGGMHGGALVTQFSAISQVAPLFATMPINSIIAIIILIFGHSYALQYGEAKKSKKSHKSKSMRGGGVPIFSQILIPMGMSNLVAIASLLLLHYFAVKRKKMEIGIHGGGIKSELQASIFENEMKIHEMIGGNKIYKSLQSIFLGSFNKLDKEQVGGKKSKNKLEKAIAPLNKDQYIAIGIMNLLKSLFTNFYYTIYKNKKKSASYYSKKTYIFFKKIFDVMAPVSVALYLKKSKNSTKVSKK